MCFAGRITQQYGNPYKADSYNFFRIAVLFSDGRVSFLTDISLIVGLFRFSSHATHFTAPQLLFDRS
jgi:hypothetical protein